MCIYPLRRSRYTAPIPLPSHRALDELAVNSKAGLDLVLNMKHAEMAARDPVILVRYSNLTTGRGPHWIPADARQAR